MAEGEGVRAEETGGRRVVGEEEEEEEGVMGEAAERSRSAMATRPSTAAAGASPRAAELPLSAASTSSPARLSQVGFFITET